MITPPVNELVRDVAPPALSVATLAPEPAPACNLLRQPTMIAYAAHATRDCFGQLIGRTAGLAIYTATFALAEKMFPLTIAAGVVGAVSGAVQSWMLASDHIGTDTPLHLLATLGCTAAGAAVGGSISAIGVTQPVVTLAVGGTLTAVASVMRLWAQNPEDHARVDSSKGIVAFLGAATTLTAVATVDRDWHAPEDIAARNMGTLGESLTVEFFKSTLERVGPSVDRQALNFNGKMLASLAGSLPYVIATVLLNGVVSGLLQPSGPSDTHRFNELILPTLIGALANAVRGFVNASAVGQLHAHQIGIAHPERELLRPHQGFRKPERDRIIVKTAIRFFISSCRNAIYTKLRAKGLSPTEAASIAQLIYGFFAQNRDVIFDILHGEGWVPVKEESPA